MDLDQAKVHHERGQFAEAEGIYNALLNENFDRNDVLFLYGTLLIQQGKHGLASNVLRMALDDSDQDAHVYQNLSNCYRIEHHDEECRGLLQTAIKKKPSAELWASLGNTYINNGTPDDALRCYKEALQLDPSNDLIKFHCGLACLELGEYKAGWKGYELGFRAGNRTYRNYRNLPEWNGEPGKTVIIWGEQGIGDEIMFASCMDEAISLCKQVIFDCHPRLLETYKRSFPNAICYGTRKNQVLEWLQDCGAEAHCSITKLALMWRNHKSEFPRKHYLKADAKAVAEFRAKGDGRMRVGFSWTGGTKNTRRDLRSFNLEQLLPILKQDCDFYSLQYTPESSKEVCKLEENTGLRVKHFPDKVECKDYDVTMNFIASMDLVISVCTTAIHAAGSLGVPCWVMTPSAPAWRYGLAGEDHDWYGSVRMFRQKAGEDWSPVIGKIAFELESLVKERKRIAA